MELQLGERKISVLRAMGAHSISQYPKTSSRSRDAFILGLPC